MARAARDARRGDNSLTAKDDAGAAQCAALIAPYGTIAQEGRRTTLVASLGIALDDEKVSKGAEAKLAQPKVAAIKTVRFQPDFFMAGSFCESQARAPDLSWTDQ